MTRPEVIAWCNELQARTGFWGRTASGKRRLELIGLLGACGEIDVVPVLLSVALGRDRREAEASAAGVTRLMGEASPSAIAALDQALRDGAHWGWDSWNRIEPKDVGTLASLGVALLRLATLHRNGYVREAAVRRLGEETDGSELPYLLVRLNDWVAPIRAVASELLETRLTPAYANAWAASLLLLDRLRRQKRGPHESLVRRAIRLLQRVECGGALLLALRSRDKRVRREAFRVARAADGFDPGTLATMASGDVDPLIRLFAVNELAPSSLDGALVDSFAPIRRKALELVEKKVGAGAVPRFEAALFDSNAGLRAIAVAALRRYAPGLDVAERYRKVVADGAGRLLTPAIYGLAELGAPDDATLVTPLLGHRYAKVRRAALLALARLAPDSSKEAQWTALRDRSASVSGTARTLLASGVNAAHASRLEAVVADGALSPRPRMNALWLIARVGKWDSLPCLLRATAIDGELSARALVLLGRWLARYNRSFSTPTTEAAAAIRDALAAAARTVPVPLAGEITAILTSARR